MESIIKVKGNLIYTVMRATNKPDEVMEWILGFKKAVKETYEEKGPVCVLTDLTDAVPPRDQISKENIIQMENEIKEKIKKSAVLVSDLPMQAVVKVIFLFSGRSNVKVFRDKQEAIRWITADSST